MRRRALEPTQRIIELKEQREYTHGPQGPERIALKRRWPNEPLRKRNSYGDPLHQVGLLLDQKGPLSVAPQHHAEDVLELVHCLHGLAHDSEILVEKIAQGVGKISTTAPYQLIQLTRLANVTKIQHHSYVP